MVISQKNTLSWELPRPVLFDFLPCEGNITPNIGLDLTRKVHTASIRRKVHSSPCFPLLCTFLA